jgi:adenine-specific DNA-methyltransferase
MQKLSRDFAATRIDGTETAVSGSSVMSAEQMDLAVWGPVVFRPIHYLGSKLRVLDQILRQIDDIDPIGGRVADLFAGSGTVAAALSMQRSVTAVDIQEYSRVLCSALLGLSRFSREEAVWFNQKVRTSSTRRALMEGMEPLIAFEHECIDKALRGEAEPICEILQHGSILLHERKATKPVSSGLQMALDECVHRFAENGIAGDRCATVSRYFGGIYFSYQQAAELDAALDCIDQEAAASQDCFLSAVLSTASTIVNTIGKQFAQPLMPITSTGAPKIHLLQQIKEDRSASALDTLNAWLFRYASLPPPSKSHSVIRGDYAVIADEKEQEIRVVYADPPYTRDHYSRYYHVLETMCLRDNPEVSNVPGREGNVSRGMYRADRYQSPFCIKTKAKDAFEGLFGTVQRLHVPLLLSYSPYRTDCEARPRLMTIAMLDELARKYFRYVDLISAGRIAHNKLNTTTLNFASSYEAEIFLLCRP